MVRLTYPAYVVRRMSASRTASVAVRTIWGRNVVERTDVIRVLLSDEQSLFREAVKVVLSREDDLVVVGEAADGLQAVAEAERLQPDVALLDADLPNCDGIRATAADHAAASPIVA